MIHTSSGLRAALLVAALGACGTPARYPVLSGPRDWSAHPAIVELALPTDAPVFAVSDVHGGYDRLVALLARHGVIAGVPGSPTAARWAAGAAVLVVAGDLIDKGPSSLEVLDLVRALDADAPATGGRVIATLGNHEAEFLVDPLNAKADADDGVDPELRAQHLRSDGDRQRERPPRAVAARAPVRRARGVVVLLARGQHRRAHRGRPRGDAPYRGERPRLRRPGRRRR